MLEMRRRHALLIGQLVQIDRHVPVISPGTLTYDLRGDNTTWNPDEEISAVLPSRTIIYIFHVSSSSVMMQEKTKR